MPSLLNRPCKLFKSQGPPSPKRRISSPDTEARDLEDIRDFEAAPTKPSGSPLISQLYDDATAFQKVLIRSGCIKSRTPPGVSDGQNGFQDLVARDLTNAERAIADHAAKINASADSWLTATDHLEHNVLYDGEDEIPSLSSDKTSLSSGDSSISQAALEPKRQNTRESIPTMEPKEIIDILVDEFGPVAMEGEEETLLLELDGCLLQDVVIVGVIHLTSHRLAFHASLFATRPELYASQEVIKSGTVTMHRKGWHAKRRVWLELNHDMLVTYSSSSDEGRTRPLCTVLFSMLKEITPLDPKNPRLIRFIFHTQNDKADDYMEFDTEESAKDWRREIKGAIALYYHRRQKSYSRAVPDAEAGVRLSCPLDRISSYESVQLLGLSTIVSLHVKIGEMDANANEDLGILEAQDFQIGPIVPTQAWNKLGEAIDQAKRRSQNKPKYPIFVDFGPYNFLQNPVVDGPVVPESPTSKETEIREALGFAPDTDLWIARARIYRTVTTSGYFAISNHHVGFWSKNLTTRDILFRLSILKIKSAEPFSLKWLKVDGMSISIEGQVDMKFVFRSVALRDEAISRINAILLTRPGNTSVSTSVVASRSSTPPLTSAISLESPTRSVDSVGSPTGTISPFRSATELFAPLSRSLAAVTAAAVELPPNLRYELPKIINLPQNMLVTRVHLHFVCLTIGSRGDVQPYIALGLGLKKEGHRVTIATHEEYKGWIEGFGLEHRQAGGDPGALMKLSVENKMFSPDFFRESLTHFRPWLDQLLLDSWEACQGADVLLESPSAMAGVHIAEALNIPYFRTFTMPWTKTTEFPHAFLSPPVESPTFNSASYVLFSNVMWAATSGQINKWRKNTLKIGSTDMGHLAQSKIVFIYNFSTAVVPKPLDWPDTTVVSGYWFLDNPDLNWTPPQSLLDWMDKARKDGKPIVYIGFGSITVPRPNRVTACIIEAVVQSDVRAIISKGWSARMSKPNPKDPEPEIPPECYQLDKVPHDWLFPQIDAALHHGGAGTTGASLRAGIPTLIKPWFGDQFFWASRVQRLGAGLKVPNLRVNDLADALTKATSNAMMRERAASVGERIRAEDGVHNAIYTIYTYLDRASQGRGSTS